MFWTHTQKISEYMCPAIFYIKQSVIISPIPPNGLGTEKINLLDRLLDR